MEKGYVWLPFNPITVASTINGETVWYKNKWKNLLLKIKRMFITPKYLKNGEIYSKKKIIYSYYGTININDDSSGKDYEK